MMTTDSRPISNTDEVIDVRDVIARIEELRERATCANCGEPAREDDNGAGQTVAVHDFGSTVCYDDPPGAHDDGDTTTTAELSHPLAIDEIEELAALVAFLDGFKGYGGDEQWDGDWYPVTLVRDSYFTEYAQELAEDIGAIDPDASWPLGYIDWERAARDLRIDYTAADFDGVTYWGRS